MNKWITITVLIIIVTFFLGCMSSSDMSMPESDPNIRGMVVEKKSDVTFIVKTISRGSDNQSSNNETVKITENTKVFWILDKDGSIKEASINDITVNSSMIVVWCIQNSDRSWSATDIGIMQKGGRERK